jgi:hypothetical protein
MLRNIVLDHSREFKTLEEIEEFYKSFRYEEKAISTEEALSLKSKGYHIEYPKTSILYNYVVEPYKEMYTCRIGRQVNKDNDKSVNVCVVGNYNNAFPKREMLDILAVLVRGLLKQYPTIKPSRVLPLRYFKKNNDGPGLLFNVKRFVKEYLLNDPIK